MSFARVPLYDRLGNVVAHTLVDAADEEAVVAAGPWRLHRPGYAVRAFCVDGVYRTVSLARFLLGLSYGDSRQVDHVTRDTLDDRRSNLRIVTQAVNRQNLVPRAGCTSAFRGVSWRKDRGKWHAYARVDGHQYHLGFFTTEEGAAEAARQFRLETMPGAID